MAAPVKSLESGIKALMENMVSFDGSEGKTKADGDKYYAEQLASLIDDHCKALVAKLSTVDIMQLGLMAGQYPVAAPAPIEVSLDIIEKPI